MSLAVTNPLRTRPRFPFQINRFYGPQAAGLTRLWIPTLDRHWVELSRFGSVSVTNIGLSGEPVVHYAGDFSSDAFATSPSGGFDPSANDWTLVAWAMARSFTLDGSARHVFTQQDGAGTGRGWIFYDDTPAGSIISFLGNADRVSGVTASIGVFNHIALIHDNAANTLTWVIDGFQRNTNTGVAIESSTGDFVIGAHKTTTQGRLNGMVAEVRLYEGYRVPIPVIHQMWNPETRWELYEEPHFPLLTGTLDVTVPGDDTITTRRVTELEYSRF